jgi:TetR/AcrR family transcriptional regulator, transcriptional repressor for nem operon
MPRMKSAATNRKDPLTARGAQTRQRIVDATAKLIYGRGAEATRLDEVCEAGRVSKSQLYHYFEDKDALVREVITLQAKRILAAQSPPIDEIDSIDALRRWAKTVEDLHRASGGGGCPLGSLANELAHRSDAARILLQEGFLAWTDRLARGFERMQSRGDLDVDASPSELAVAVVAAVEGGLLLAKTARSPAPLKRALDMALRYVGLHCRESGTPRRSRRHR